MRPCRAAFWRSFSDNDNFPIRAKMFTIRVPAHTQLFPMLKNVMVYLVGFSGTGKLTVAHELALLLKAKVVDNHWINNPILGLIDSDRVTPFPEGVWDQIAKVRQAVLDTIATLSAPDSSFIMTHAGYDDDPEDWKIYNAIAEAAERRDALFVPIRLLCAEEELLKRVVSSERALNHKNMDPEAASRDSKGRNVLAFKHANGMTLDITALSPPDAARFILKHIQSLSPA
jgi:hypothetical protein